MQAEQHLSFGPSNYSAGIAQTMSINREAVSELETEHADVEFVGIRKLSIKCDYLGGVKEGVNEEKIRQFMENKGVIPTFIRILKSRRKGTIAIRVNVKYEILIRYFWPTVSMPDHGYLVLECFWWISCDIISTGGQLQIDTVIGGK